MYLNLKSNKKKLQIALFMYMHTSAWLSSSLNINAFGFLFYSVKDLLL